VLKAFKYGKRFLKPQIFFKLFSLTLYFFFSFLKRVIRLKVQLLNLKLRQIYILKDSLVGSNLNIVLILKPTLWLGKQTLNILHLVTKNFFFRFRFLFFFWDSLILLLCVQASLNINPILALFKKQINNFKGTHYFFLTKFYDLIVVLRRVAIFKIKGFKFSVHGKLKGIKRKRVYKKFVGKTSLSYIKNQTVTFGSTESYTRFGVFSINVSIVK
jgi:hypothetical protein